METQALTASFTVIPNRHPASDEERWLAMENPVFGKVFTDHMARATWRDGEGWADHRIVALAPLPMHPGAAVLHYAQQAFEGLKAYRHEDGSVWLFRPEANAARLAASCRRMALPEVSEQDFMAALEGLIAADRNWVPGTPGASLYLRPFVFASEPSLLVQPAHEVEFLVTASPVGAYLSPGDTGVPIWVSRGYHRANPGGTGEAKTAGNYAASMLPQQEAKEQGCQQVLFLDAKEDTYVEEFGGMNLVAVRADGSIVTPRLSGTILPGITRDSILTLLRDEGREVEERDLALSEILEGVASGEIVELFACGTAAVVTPVGRLASDDFDVTVPRVEGESVADAVLARLTDLQYGRAEDPHGWMRKVLDAPEG
ncbi:branched-chain amino acid aminotransferase [Demequina gelatinilytica]|uniref:branched-chain amino acid aminotransferase n=1 Tax=Demequina gelatinilytica TaxID=1638980 RepID=UPI0007836320|nr:branched-chain amino acid aminotransferase [Demequina gelatinilytica]